MGAMKKMHLFRDLKILQQVIFPYSQKLEEKIYFREILKNWTYSVSVFSSSEESRPLQN